MPSLWHTLPTLLLLPTAISAVTFDCNHVRIDKQSFDLSALGGPKTVHHLQYLQPSISNTTFTLDICSPLKRTKDVPKSDECSSGTRVCGIERIYNEADNSSTIERVISVAGEYATRNGRSMDPEVTRLKGSASHADSDQEGLRVELHGGKWPETRDGSLQKAIIEFRCDKDLTGNEGFEEEDKVLDVNSYGQMARRASDDEDDDGPSLPDLDKGKSLQFNSYKPDTDDIGVLRLTWKTKFACEGVANDPKGDGKKNKSPNSHWGIFTWFIIILFLLVATYIIFGSWLNYNRYGARGWDLLPHGDAIRDVPYVAKEWVGGCIDRVKGGGGGGERGGYSAV
ncbi:hypothetical protein LTR08_004573 [Meristemomyces frigidus]|nr:hypothetical protein LTR08_004573 [Meristemomyces frigidus]